MITIFTTPKPFIGHNKIIQENAIQSWKHLTPTCEVILMGNDEGVAEAASRFDCVHVPDVPCTELGTPLINGLFIAAQKLSCHQIICYANADIMFTNTLLRAVEVIKRKNNYLLVGQRSDLDITEPFDFSDNDWQYRLHHRAIEGAELHGEHAMDYFVFQKGTFLELPDLVVGRAGWDNWMIFNARKKYISVIDGTKMVLAVHQNHNYSHCIGGKQAVYFDGPEVKSNKSYIKVAMSISDALWELKSGKFRFTFVRLGLHLDRLPLLYSSLAWPVKIGRTFLNLTKIGTFLRRTYEKNMFF